MAKEKISDEQAAIMAPIIEMLLTMMRAARDAFNRHSRDRLQELQNLQAAVNQNISAASRQVQSLISRKPEAEQKILRRLDTLLSRLGTIDANLGRAGRPHQQEDPGRGPVFRQGRGPNQLSL